MSAPLRVPDGTVTAPSLSFGNETGSGIFRNAAGDIRLAVLGVLRFIWNATGAVVNGTFGIRDATGTKTVTIGAPSGLAADYALTLPTALPGSTLPLSSSSAGVLSTGQITTAQITDANITKAKLDAANASLGSSSGSFTTSSATLVDVTNQTRTLTTHGRPVLVAWQADGGSDSFLDAATAQAQFALLRDATLLGKYDLPAGQRVPISITFLDVSPSAASHTYKFQALSSAGAGTTTVSGGALAVIEL